MLAFPISLEYPLRRNTPTTTALQGLSHFDAALVDGRFRVACALKLLPFLTQDSVLFMHDFWRRPMYHAVLDFHDVIGIFMQHIPAMTRLMTLIQFNS